MEVRTNFWLTIYKCAWILIVVVCIVGAVCLFFPRYACYRDLQQQKLELQTAKLDKETDLKNLQRQQEMFTTDKDFVEMTARKMGMVKTNETIFRVVDTDARQNNQR